MWYESVIDRQRRINPGRETSAGPHNIQGDADTQTTSDAGGNDHPGQQEKDTHIQTTSAAETGRRLMAMITETAERVKRQRTMETRKRMRIDDMEAG